MSTTRAECDWACRNQVGQFTRQFLRYSVASSDPTENFATCPVGLLFLVSTLLGSGGAGGSTAQQIARTLGINSSNRGRIIDSTIDLYRVLDKSLTSGISEGGEDMGSVIRQANGIFVNKTSRLRDGFAERAERVFGATAQSVNFEGNAIDVINDWTNLKSNGLIPKLFDDPSALQRTAVLLVNVVTFNNQWKKAFPTASDDIFHLSSSETITVKMMKSRMYVFYVVSKELGSRLVHIPLKHPRFSFVVILPDQMKNMIGAERVLSGQYSVKEYLNEYYKKQIDLYLPKFQLSETTDLKSVAQQMGILDLFDPNKADLPVLQNKDDLFVDRMEQRVTLKVNEKGVEAAAASYASISVRSFIPPPKIVVNHPFVCMIYDLVLDIPIFSARVMDPRL